MKIKTRLASREIAGELYIVDAGAGRLHSLNPSGAFIWGCLEKGLGEEEAAEKLAAEFEVGAAAAAADVKEFVKTLAARGLLVR